MRAGGIGRAARLLVSVVAAFILFYASVFAALFAALFVSYSQAYGAALAHGSASDRGTLYAAATVMILGLSLTLIIYLLLERWAFGPRDARHEFRFIRRFHARVAVVALTVGSLAVLALYVSNEFSKLRDEAVREWQRRDR